MIVLFWGKYFNIPFYFLCIFDARASFEILTDTVRRNLLTSASEVFFHKVKVLSSSNSEIEGTEM